jgi:hypothetical protein
MDTKLLLVLGGIALVGLSMYVVNRFELHRTGLMRPLTTKGAAKLPTILAIVLGIGGGVLAYLGMRAG